LVGEEELERVQRGKKVVAVVRFSLSVFCEGGKKKEREERGEHLIPA